MDNPNPIFYRDLITPDDSIQALIQQLTELISKYEEMRGKIQSNAADLAKSMQGVSGATDEQREAITQSAREADALAEAMKRVREAEGAARTEVNSLKDAQREMNQLTKLQGELARSAEGSYKQLSAQYRINKIALNNMSKAQREGTEAGRKLEQETKAIYEEMNRLQKATGKYTLQVGNYELALGKATGVNVNFLSTLLDTSKASEAFHGIMGALASPIGLIAGVVGTATGAFKIWASTIHDTQITGDAFDFAMAGWNASLDVLRKSISTMDFSNLINGMWNAAEAGRQLAQTLDSVLERSGSIGIRRAKASTDLAKYLQDMRDANKTYDERIEAANKYLGKVMPFYEEEANLAKKLMDDTLDYLFETTNKRRDLTDEQEKAAKKGLATFLEEYNVTLDKIDEANKLINKIEAVEGGFLDPKTVAQYTAEIGKVSAEEREFAEIVRQYGLASNQQLQDYINRTKDYYNAVSAGELENMRIITQRNNLIAQRDKALKGGGVSGGGTKGARQSVDRSAILEEERRAENEWYKNELAAGEALVQEIERLENEKKASRLRWLNFEKETIQLEIDAEGDSLDLRLKMINKEREIELERNRQAAIEMRQDEALINAKYDQKIFEEIDKRAENVKKRTQKAVTNARKEYGNLFQVFGINLGTKDEADEVLRERESALISAIDNIKDSVSSLIDSWREAGKAAVEAADAQVDAAQKVVDSEREAAANGYANSVQRAERELALAKKQREEAQKEAERAHRAQLLMDTATQTSSLITASANIWKSLSGIPVVGPGLAVTALASMWASFAAARVKALQVTKETYGDGTVELLQGGSHASGHDISLGYTKDGKERRAEGGEFFAVINKRNSRRFRDVIPDVINSLNDGSFAERYQRAGQQLKGIAIQMMTPNLGRLEADVDAIRKQGEERRSIEGGITIIRYKNLTRRIKS